MERVQAMIDKSVGDSKDVFLAHMEEKYGTQFHPISYNSSGVMTNEKFRCYAEGTDRERDCVCVYRREENGETVFYDNYFGILIRDEYERRIQQICTEAAGESKAYVYQYTVAFFDNEFNVGNTIDDVIAKGESVSASKYFFFEVEPGTEADFQRVCDGICEELAMQKLTGTVKFIGLAEGQLENITEENFMDYLPSMIKPDGTICLMMSSSVVTLK